jgi:hypothetical protein
MIQLLVGLKTELGAVIAGLNENRLAGPAELAVLDQAVLEGGV